VHAEDRGQEEARDEHDVPIGSSHLLIDRPREAAIWARKAIHLKPEFSQWHFVLLAALAAQGQTDDPAGALADCLARRPNASVDKVGQLPFRSPAHRERFVLGARRAGLPESPGNSVF
jgi:hypothetical protein